MKGKLLRITTVPESLRTLLSGQLAFMREQGFTVWAASAGPVHEQKMDGCPHFTLPLTRRPFSPLRDVWALWKTYQLVCQLRPDIVHTHTPKAGLIGMWAAWMAGVPVRIHTVAGLPLMERRGFWRWLFTRAEQLTYWFSTSVWPNSFGLEAYIRQHLYNGPKLRVIGNGSSNGIDLQYVRQTPELTKRAKDLEKQLFIPHNAFVWVFVGRIVRDKGIAELVTAFRELARERPDSRLILVGYEEALNSISQKTKQLIINEKCIISVGFQADIRPYVSLANALVLPSYREGLPNVLLQAACLERPVVASDIVGCRDVLIEGETGLLTPPKNPVTLHDTMLRLMTDAALCEKMGQAARAHAKAHYDQQTVWQALLLAYKQTLSAIRH
ncbi:MAG: glycosyltransferase family 4 protein [Rudanella sp.]|nr:glycosyltransferase family 4 protein [Rudanella sp.]